MKKTIFLSIALLFLNIFCSSAQSHAPQWLVNLYLTDSTKLAPTQGMPDMFAPKAVELVFYKQMNDSVSYCIYRADNGVCMLYYLATQKNRKRFTESQIANKCTPENSSITFTSSSFQLDSISNVIVVINETETASDQYIVNDGQFKRFKPGFNRTNAVIEKTETKKQLKIDDSGVVEESKVR